MPHQPVRERTVLRLWLGRLAVPAAIVVSVLLTTAFWSRETDYWKGEAEHWNDISYRVADNSENIIETLRAEVSTCTDVVNGKMTDKQGTERLLQLDKEMQSHLVEQQEIKTKVESR